MPLMKLQVSTPLSDEKERELLPALSKIVSEGIGKPETYVMVSIERGAGMMSGTGDDSAFADVRSIGGLDGATNARITRELCALLKETLGIPPDRVYINFTDVAAANWGWDGGTFA